MRYPVEHFQLDRIGLDKPALVAELGPYRFEFGGIDALNNLRYVRIGSTVALLADRYSGTLMAAPEQLVDLRPFVRLRDIKGVVQDGTDWTPERIAGLGALTAKGVVQRAPAATAGEFEVRFSRHARFASDGLAVFTAPSIALFLESENTSFQTIDVAPDVDPIVHQLLNPTPPELGPLTIVGRGTAPAIAWTGPGRLQSSATLSTPDWQDVPGATSPYPLPLAGGARFYRLIQ